MLLRSQGLTRTVLLCLTISTACTSSSEPRLTGPATIVVQSQVATSATLNGSVAPIPQFVVKDSGGHALPNVTVAFFATPGSTVTPTSVSTDANGVAKPSAWLVGTRAGNISLTAAVAVPAMSATVTVVVPAGPATRLTVPSTLTLGLTDTSTLSAVAADGYGNVLPETAISLTSSNTAVATVSGIRVIAKSPGDAQITASVTGTPLSAQVSVSVQERFGHLTGRPFGIAYAAGQPGSILVSSLDVNSLEFVNAATFAVGPMVGVSFTPSDVFVSASGALAYVSAVDGSEVAVVNVSSATKQSGIADPGSARVVLSPDGSKLYVGKNGGLDVFSTATGVKTASFALGTQVNGLALSSDGSVLYASERYSGKIWRFVTATMTATDSINVGGAPQDIALHEASGNVYVANEGGWVDVLSASHVASVARFNNTPGAFALRLTADGSKLFVSGSLAGQVYILDRATGTLAKSVSVGGIPRRIAFLPDGRALVANEGGWVNLVH